MTGQLSTYREEIFNFLRTVTIKFEPFAYLMGESYMKQYGLTDPHQKWNPYYINLTGEYTPNNQTMEVYSAEVDHIVAFDKTLIARYPKTAAIYKVPNKEYFILEERYPKNRGLIRTMVYPAGDMDTVLAADNFDLLGYDDSLLEENERANLVMTLKQFLKMVKERWWIKEYDYEDMYAVTFWSMLWQMLPEVLLMQRFLNIKTPYVHSFHIWEYLVSKGLSDYRDVLTRDQANWLYRNIDYILCNKGKTSTLDILTRNLLKNIYVSLLAKDMVQNSEKMMDEDYTTEPKYVNFRLTTGKEVNREDHKYLVDKLVKSNIEEDLTLEDINRQSKQLSNIPYNTLPTKFLEFKKDAVNTQNEALMVNFFLDTLIYRYSRNDISYIVNITDPISRNVIKLYAGDAIAFWWYCCKRSIGESNDDITTIPSKYRLHIPFKAVKPSAYDMRTSVYFDSTEYNIRTLIDYDKMMDSDINWHPKAFTSVTDFSNHAAEQFRALLYFNQCMEQSNKFLYHRAMQSFFEDIRERGWIEFSLSKYTTYTEWRNSLPAVDALIKRYDNTARSLSVWDGLGASIFDALFPINYNKYSEFIGIIRNLEQIYASIRDLFIQLGSYNITYLENERDAYSYLRIPEPDFYIGTTSNQMNDFWILVLRNLIFTHKDSIYLDLPHCRFDLSTNLAGVSYQFKNKLAVGIDWSHKTTIYDKHVLQDKHVLHQDKNTITHTGRICIEA